MDRREVCRVAHIRHVVGACAERRRGTRRLPPELDSTCTRTDENHCTPHQGSECGLASRVIAPPPDFSSGIRRPCLRRTKGRVSRRPGRRRLRQRAVRDCCSPHRPKERPRQPMQRGSIDRRQYAATVEADTPACRAIWRCSKRCRRNSTISKAVGGAIERGGGLAATKRQPALLRHRPNSGPAICARSVPSRHDRLRPAVHSSRIR